MPKTVSRAHRGAVVFAALTALTVLAAPFNAAFGDPTVTVINPATMPALTSSVDDPGRAAYQSTRGQSKADCPSSDCVVDFATVPAHHRLVIQHVSGQLFFASTASFAKITLFDTGGVSGTFFTAPFAQPAGQAALGTSSFDQLVLHYFDAGEHGEHPAVAIGMTPTAPSTGGQTITLSGYLLDCTAAPCAPIAH